MGTYYYANTGSQSVATVEWWTGVGGTGSQLSWPPADGDTLDAYNQTGIDIDVDLGSSIIQLLLKNTNGGGFVNSSAQTLYCNLVSTSTALIVQSGVNALTINCTTGITTGSEDVIQVNGAATITINNATITGSASLFKRPIDVANVAATIILNNCISTAGGSLTCAVVECAGATAIVNVVGGSMTGGGFNTASGIYMASGGTVNISGGCVLTPATGPAIIDNANTATITVTASDIVNNAVQAIFSRGIVQYVPGAGNFVQYNTGGSPSTVKMYAQRPMYSPANMSGGF